MSLETGRMKTSIDKMSVRYVKEQHPIRAYGGGNLCARQGVGLRGNAEGERSSNKVIFLELIELEEMYDAVLSDNPKSGRSYNACPMIQSELLEFRRIW